METNWKEVYSSDSLVVAGFEQKPPTYYDRVMSDISLPTLNYVKSQRMLKALQLRDDSTYDRLQVRLKVQVAKSSLFARGAAEA